MWSPPHASLLSPLAHQSRIRDPPCEAEQLNETLNSLLAVRGLNESRLYVMQDGTNARVSAAVRARGLHLVALPAQDGGGSDKSGSSIARAYGAALTKAFELSGDEALLVVEDDLLFSPDLMEYFLAGYHVLKADPSLWCVSAWNDNGFGGLVHDQKRLLRTGFFPGLGWLLTRKLYEEELQKKWPTEHWDHWMRSETVGDLQGLSTDAPTCLLTRSLTFLLTSRSS